MVKLLDGFLVFANGKFILKNNCNIAVDNFRKYGNMANDFSNKIERLELENFTCFKHAAFEFSSGINVFIGENGTGKTHLLKVLYAAMLANRDFEEDRQPNMKGLYGNIRFLENFWNQAQILIAKNNELAFKSGKEGLPKIKINIGNHPFSSSLLEETFTLKESATIFKKLTSQPFFLPPNEMLSWYRGFVNIFEKFQIDLDRTYRDLALALSGNLLNNSYLEEAKKLTTELEEAIDAKIIKKADGKFYFQFKNGNEVSSGTNAQGINKLGQIIYLIQSGAIDKNTILFWDEPEANLNPKYILKVVQFLKVLANAGCQIFVSTHNYLVAYELSLMSEYRDVQKDIPDIKFFGLYKSEAGTMVKAGKTMIDLDDDPILNAHAKHYEKGEQLTEKQLEKDLQ